MKKTRKILATIVSIFLVLAMMPTLPVLAADETAQPDNTWDTWDGTASVEWIGEANTFDASGENTNTTPYNGKYYNVKNYTAGTVFVIDSAEDLAGLAALVNVEAHKQVAWFLNCTFVITKNLDLNNSVWKPIGLNNDYIFCGTIKGSLGDETGESDTSITIRNMNMTNDNNMGLVSTQPTGGIQNITISSSKLINTTKNAIGSFVGYIRVVDGLNTPAPVYSNLTSNATLEGKGDTCVAGGIIANSLRGDVTMENCEFTGIIENVGNISGGIIGYAQKAVKITDCDVNAKITAKHTSDGLIGGLIGRINEGATISNCTVTGTFNNAGVGRSGGVVGYAALGVNVSNCTVSGTITSKNGGTNRGGVGGVGGLVRGQSIVENVVVTANIAGAALAGTAGIIGYNDKTDASIVIKNSYVGGTLEGGYGVGGFIGNTTGTNTIENCQFDGIVESTHTQNGAFVGRFNATSGGSTLTMTKCLNTGFAMNTRGDESAFSWVGLSANKTGAATYTFTNCYSNTAIPFAGRCDADTSTTTEWTFKIDDAEAQTVVPGDDVRALADFKPTVVSFFDMKPANLTGFDFTNVWIERAGKIPTLKVAEASAVSTYEDLSFFKVNTTDKKVETLVVNDEHKLLGLLKVSKVITDPNDVKVELSRTLDYTEMGFSDTWKSALADSYIGNADSAADAKIVRTGVQKGTDPETLNSIRVIAEIAGNDYDAAGFEILMSYVDANGVTHYSKAQTATMTKCYTSFLANGQKVEPTAEGNYFVIVTINEPIKGVSLDDITVTFCGFVTEGEINTYAAATDKTLA